MKAPKLTTVGALIMMCAALACGRGMVVSEGGGVGLGILMLALGLALFVAGRMRQ